MLLALLLVVFLGYVFLRWRFSFWARHGVPYVKPSLVGGAFKDVLLFRKTIGEVYQDMYRKMSDHPFCGYFKCIEPAILIRDPELVRTILVKDFSSFQDNDFHQDKSVDPMFGRSPFVVKGNSWKRVRSQLTPIFTSSRVKSISPQMMVVNQELTNYLERELQAHVTGGLDVKKMAHLYATDSVALCMLGIRGNALNDPSGEFGSIGDFLLEESLLGSIQVIAIMLLPKISHWLRLRFIPENVAQFFRTVVKETSAHREQSGETVVDYLQASIALRQKGEEFSDEDAAAHAAMFFLDGVEPTSSILALALYELTANQEVQEKVAEEVTKVLSRHNGLLDVTSLQEMTYLDMVASETLRKYPPLRSLDRMCTKPYDLETAAGKTCRIEPGTPVIIPTYALHWDPEIYPDPERFLPERFSESNKESRSKYAYLPFGEGPRACIGVRYATTVIKMALATIVRDYRLQRSGQTPTSVSHSRYSPFYLAAGECLRVRFQPREEKKPDRSAGSSD